MDTRKFGAAIRERRQALNLTQAVAAEFAGMSRSGFGNIETGTYAAGLKTQMRLTEVFGLRLAS